MGIDEAVRTVISKYADFSGRARRSEYWYWILALVGVEIVGLILAQISSLFGILLIIAYLALVVPTIAVGVRRLHDTGKSGWLMLLGLVPLLGIILLVFMVADSAPGDNAYGPNPKGVGGLDAAPLGYGPA